ncbi:unnamed protein product, partial [Leptidea sinapis]
MSLKNQMAEVQCMEPENYRKFFRFLCWSGNRISDKTSNRRVSKKDKTRTIKLHNAFGTSCFAPALLSNPSQFAVYATVRKSIISRWRYIHGSVCDLSEDSDNDDQIVVPGKLPKITGIGLRTVFSLIRLSRNNDTGLCESALRALLDVLQDHQPGDLRSENDEVISTLHDVLVDVSKGIGGKTATSLTSLSTSCLIALSVARGDTEIILNTVSCLIMVSQKLSDEYLQVPVNLTVLQKSVQQEVLGAPSRYFWLDYGVPHQCLVNSFPVDLPPQLLSGSQELVIRSFVSDGSYLFIFTSKGLVKIGSGYGNTIRQHVYLYKPDFYASDRHGWIGIWKDNLYVRIGRKKTDIYEIDKNTFQVKSIIHLNAGTPIPTESKSAVFTDGNNLGLVTLTKFDNLNIRFYDLETTACKRLDGQTHDLEPQKELNVILMRRTTLVLGTAPYEDVGSRRILDLDVPVAVQLDDSEDDPLTAINAGQDFGLLTTASGKVYYTGKPSSLGYKVAATYTSRWTLMKETVFTRHEYPKVRKTRVIQVAVGHEGVHAILVLDNGTAMFTGIARRGEDGDGNKRRSPKPSRPKKIAKAENFYVVYAACNYGSTALLTRQGLVLMFGKDTQHCDAAGIVTGLKHERIVQLHISVPFMHCTNFQMALGKAHAIALTNLGQVYSFGINNKGQCGREFGYTKEMPRASAIAAGSNHTAVITKEGEVYTFGNYHKGGLGRPRTEEPREERSPIWYATPGRVPRLGPKYNYKAVSVSASGDQTFVQVSQALLKTDTLFSATITANENTIIILPNCPEHTFKCVTIYKLDGSCYSFSGPEQVDFVNTLACLDPLYDVLWCYQPQMKVIKVYNIQAFDSHKLQRCSKNDPEGFINDMEYEYPQYGIMRKFDDFRDVENIKWVSSNEDRPADGVAIANVSILNQDLAIPSVKFSSVTRLHAALNLIGTLDSLLYAHDNSQGGGWGYTDNSVEAIRFMCDTDILLGGYALYGGRGDYTAKLKLFDLGPEGGDQECEGELIAETGAQRWFVALVSIRGPSSDCGSSGRVSVTIEDITFNFKATKKSNNGTDVNAGQIPCLLYNVINPVRIPKRRRYPGDDIIALSKSIYKHVTVSSLKSLITLLQWTWNTYNETLLDTNGQVTINYSKLAAMKHQKRLVYVIRACLRLLKSYISDLYPENILKRNSQETIALVETIAVARNLIQVIMSNQIPTCAMLSKKFGRNKSHRVCYVQFALEMTNSILKEAHETVTVCFHAFYPTPMLKWHHLCSLLCNVSDGIVPGSQVRELMATCAAMCGYKSLFSVLQDIVPLTQSCFMSNELKKLKRNYKICVNIVMIPIKDKMMTRQCGQPHDHGEILQNEKLGDYCCKFLVRLVAELAYNSRNITDDNDTEYIKHLITPSRFIRVNRNPTWSTSTINKDIICFTVDREGVMLAGACVYGGTANINFTLELVRDDDTKYALRLSTKGGLTVFGDNGLASVKGPDGTTFHFSSNTISCNGTNVSRGQLPCIIYYGSTKPGNSPENPDAALARMRAITTRVASMVIERGAELFRVLRNELTTEDLRRNSAVLQQSSVVTTLLPFVLSHLEDLEDSKSVVKILETIHKLLPHVAAMNLLVPSGEETSTVTTTQYYTWIESPHPYKQASVSNMRLMFPPQVSWIVLEIDPRSITAQPEDSLTIYAVAGSPRHQCHCSTDYRIGDPPFRKL